MEVRPNKRKKAFMEGGKSNNKNRAKYAHKTWWSGVGCWTVSGGERWVEGGVRSIKTVLEAVSRGGRAALKKKCKWKGGVTDCGESVGEKFKKKNKDAQGPLKKFSCDVGISVGRPAG